ncbi:MAG: PKD domain-containing protein, partial [Bacteroidales bacterium]
STASNSDTLFYTPHGNDSVHARLSSSYMCPRNTPALSPKVYIQNYAYPQLQKSKDTTLCIGVSTALYFEGTPFYRNFSHPNVPHEQKENRFVFATPTNLSEEIAEVLYSVEGYFHSACVTRDTIRVRYRPLTHSQLVFSISQDSLCLGSSFSFRAMGYPNLYYKWYVNGLEKGLTVNDANERLGSTWSYTPQIGDSIWVQQVLSPDLACGSYTLISSQKIKPNPVNLQIDLSADTTLCAGHPAQVWATTNALKFYWKPTATMLSPNQLSSLVWPQQTTAYIFSATLGACFSKDTLWVNVNPSPKVPLILDAWVCAHDSATAKALLGLQTPDTTCLYQWFTDTLAPSIHQGFSYQALPGIYFVSALNALHCASPFATGQVGVDAPVIAAFELNTPAFANTELSFVNYSENAQNWNWHFGDGLSSTLESPTHTYDSIGLYLVSLRATNQRQCFDTVSLAVDVRYNPQNYEESTVFIPSAFAPGAS